MKRAAPSIEAHIEALDRQAMLAKIMARRFWAMLTHRLSAQGLSAQLIDDVLSWEARAIVDPTFDAAERLWDREQIFVEPCRRNPGVDIEVYDLVFAGGERRLIDRAQLLMMGGQPPEARP